MAHRQSMREDVQKPEACDDQHAQTWWEVQRFAIFRRRFLTVYLIMMAADWMQGPYVYRLYSYYGFSRSDNGILFIAGFGASLVFGTWSGPLADTYGRKNSCILYGVTYFLSCATKHFPNFWILMLGRVLGGIATSILWSSFESWMVSEHNAQGFPGEKIGSTFSLMYTLNGILAILSGFVAQAANDYFQHPVAPFDVSGLLLLIGTLIIWATWSENYGDESRTLLQQMRQAVEEVKSDTRVALVGLQQALFEGAMYTFVFMWTPTLEERRDPVTNVTEKISIPHGVIFASFMVACSLGGTLFGALESRFAPTTLMRVIYCGAAISMVVPLVLPMYHELIMLAFLTFEVLVGMFWSCIGTLRSKYVPEHVRATVINLFRVPLNAFVCIVLYCQGFFQVRDVFLVCILLHIGALSATLMLPPVTSAQSNRYTNSNVQLSASQSDVDDPTGATSLSSSSSVHPSLPDSAEDYD